MGLMAAAPGTIRKLIAAPPIAPLNARPGR